MTKELKNPCLHCSAREQTVGNLCDECAVLPRCKKCDVFMDGLCKQSSIDPSRCESCEGMEEKIKFGCQSCGVKIPLFSNRRLLKLYYEINGNYCINCCVGAQNKSRLPSTEYKKDYEGYLSFMEILHLQGKISNGDWLYAVEMNPHDVNTPSLIIPHMDDEEALTSEF